MGTQPQAGHKVIFTKTTLWGQFFPSLPSPRSWLVIESRDAPESSGSPQAGPLRHAWGGRHPPQNPGLRPGSPHSLGAPEIPAVLRGFPCTPPPRGLSDPPTSPRNPETTAAPGCPCSRSCHATPPSPSQPRSPGRRDGRPSPPGSSQTFCPGPKLPIPP